MGWRVVLSGGGTGGHVYPALAIGEALRQLADVELLYVGTADGLEARVVPPHGVPFEAIPAAGVIRKSPAAALRGLWLLARGALRARAVLARFRPHAVVGTGGYASAPVVWAACRMGVPTLIHEQNAVPGVTNRWLSRCADVVAVPHPEVAARFPAARRVVVTGNPVRPAILAADRDACRARLGMAGLRHVVLVVGGSRGARTLNEAVLGLLPAWLGWQETGLAWVTGERYHAEMAARAREAGYDPATHTHVRIMPYAHAMEELLAASDLVVARAGAITLAEITARGLPAVLVPSPNVTHDHQRHNARLLERAGAAVVIEDHRCGPERLGAAIRALLGDPSRLQAMAAASRRLGRPDAARRLAELVLELARRGGLPGGPGAGPPEGRGAGGPRGGGADARTRGGSPTYDGPR